MALPGIVSSGRLVCGRIVSFSQRQLEAPASAAGGAEDLEEAAAIDGVELVEVVRRELAADEVRDLVGGRFALGRKLALELRQGLPDPGLRGARVVAGGGGGRVVEEVAHRFARPGERRAGGWNDGCAGDPGRVRRVSPAAQRWQVLQDSCG